MSPTFIVASLVVLLSGASKALNSKNPSPFDDLSPDEIRDVVRIIQESNLFLSSAEFPLVRMHEPKKSDWLAGNANDQRFGSAAVFELEKNILTDVVVDLRAKSIIKVQAYDDGVAPPVLQSEAIMAERIVRNDVRWQEAILKRGIPLDLAVISPWLPGTLLDSEAGPGKRIVRGITNFNNPLARFHHYAVVEGVIAVVDLVKEAVIDVWDDDFANITSAIEELPDFTTKPLLTPLVISQPEGSSIQVNGQELSWYKWKLRYSVDPMHGLQLYHVTYNGDCAERSVLYKLSLGEMFVPYGATGRPWRFRHAFDAGDYGVGKNVGSLKMEVDVPDNAILLPCVMAKETDGDAVVIENCVGAFERDSVLLYKHEEWELGNATSKDTRADAAARRGRELVLTLTTRIGNYDYAFDYVLHMDGTIDVKSRLTGIVLAKGIQKAKNDPTCLEDCSSLLSDYLVGPPHQHFFNYRIDLDVDGVKNHVAEVDVTLDPVEADPLPWDHGTFSPKKTLLKTETFREHDLKHHRSWHVLNAHSRNAFGSPRGYALKVGDVPSFTYLPEENPLLSRVQFVKHPFWATLYNDEEQHPMSKYPRTGKAGEGLPEFVRNEESLQDEDTVLWYTFGVTHTTRPEEWPIMNVHNAFGFSLVPYNFLSQNSEMALKGKCP